ncbi:GntR family transcriptional regulator [Texcoconibacillus texcoconensis]|uniref:GntR family transcriptional regulator n=1 Tax=Texcoconibacillus texcoconensis TaxID=1095777 RepID=A0A840QPI3_9BACI|nr:GntR family transcriptional regulator [Texcoconibacillus texcoconensis]MBB5173284.1 GntR family transcriptional regulator [Texcoconibacillus texcoconensis]
MLLNIDPKSVTPLYEQVIQQIKELCARGVLSPNEKLPSVRELSAQMLINPNTVSKAYRELERQGVIVSIHGRGTFISEDFISEQTPAQREKIKNELKQLVIDSYYAGVQKETLFSWLEDFYEEIGGEDDES